MSIFEKLNQINVNDKKETKGKLTYLSWCFAWGELKKIDPLAFYTVYENERGWNYHTDNATCWVKVGVTVHYDITDETGTKLSVPLEHIEYLPVMDYNNKSIPLETVTSMDVNKAIQRAITKAIARHGLGLYIYAGEDLPEEDARKAKDLATIKDELAAFCNSYDASGKTTANVWKKYKVDEMTEPEDVRKILDKYKAAAEKKAQEKTEGANNG